MEQSILKSLKKVLGVEPSYDVFDDDILMHLNSIFANLDQMGVGPPGGFSVEDDSTLWSDYIGDDKNLNSVKTYISLKIRLLFDPPQNSNITSAMNEQIKEIEWRLYTKGENERWTSPTIII